MIQEISILVKKELKLEWRSKYAIGGLLLYVVSTIFVAYLSFKKIVTVPTWNALFWIILLFAATNAIAKSFVQESKGKRLYLYSLSSPQAIIFSKIIYNAVLVSVLAFLTYVVFAVLLGDLVQDHLTFATALFLGAVGFSSTLTLISAIASQSDNNMTLMSILGFPIILPLLMTLIKLSKNAIDGLAWSVNYKYVGVLLMLNVIVIILSYLLFPYLWRE